MAARERFEEMMMQRDEGVQLRSDRLNTSRKEDSDLRSRGFR